MTALPERFLCSNVSYFYYDAKTFFLDAKEAGFKACELYLGTPQIFVDGKTTDDFSDLENLSEKYDVRIRAVHPETISYRYSLLRKDPRWRELSVKAHLRAIDYAKMIHAEVVHMNLIGWFRDEPREDVIARTASSIKEILDYGATQNIDIVLKTQPYSKGSILSTIEEAKLLRKDIPLNYICNIEALEEANETLESWMSELGDFTRGISCSSVSQLETAVKWLGENEFSGDIICHFSDDDYLDEPGKAQCEAAKILEVM